MLRVKPTHLGAMYDAETGTHRVPKPDEYFDAKDPFVAQHRDAFGTDEELAALADASREVVESAPVEQMTSAPGEKRSVRRSTKK